MTATTATTATTDLDAGRVLVTGGTGFLGRRVVAELVERGHAVRCLVRATSSRERFPAGVELVEGDVADAASVLRAARGCRRIVHGAALVKILAPAADFDRVNVAGLDHVLAAASAAGVEKGVYVSSFMALGPTEAGPGGVLDESASADDRRWINDYERTKTLADRRARAAIDAGAPWNVVYPGVIYGPGELTEGNIVVRHVLDLVHRRVPGLLGRADRRWNYSFVDDVARGVVTVLASAPPGERYVLAGDNVTQGQFYATVARLTGVAAPRLRFPDAVAKATGALMKAWARATGGVPKLTPDLVEVYRHDWALSSAKAERELGYTWRSLEEGLAATIDWLRASGRWTAA